MTVGRTTWSPDETPGLPLIQQDMDAFFEGKGVIDYCRKCNAQGTEHTIIEKPAGVNQYFGGVPQQTRHCTGCGASDGPWVKAKYVGSY